MPRLIFVVALQMDGICKEVERRSGEWILQHRREKREREKKKKSLLQCTFLSGISAVEQRLGIGTKKNDDSTTRRTLCHVSTQLCIRRTDLIKCSPLPLNSNNIV